MMNLTKVFSTWALIAATAMQVSAQADDCYPPRPSTLVVDAADVLSPEQESVLESKLVALDRETSNQVVVVTINELCAGDAAMTAFEIGNRWQVGQSEFDNGLVILVKPKVGNERGHAFIATGYGLEGAIPDATAKLIVDNEMIPHFRNEDYFGGIQAAVAVVSELARGEYNYKAYNEKHAEDPPWVYFMPILFIIAIWFIVIYGRTRQYARANNLGFWAALALMSASSRSHSGSYSGFRSGGGGGFGGGGGGFGGFGGGSFGGGGAGGSW
ncbi:MAG TPA: TPM domain-containing protein [Cryomorphaceae bacterium]|nr:TPM domain-containing protein [Cryomorphaceae bacterium]